MASVLKYRHFHPLFESCQRWYSTGFTRAVYHIRPPSAPCIASVKFGCQHHLTNLESSNCWFLNRSGPFLNKHFRGVRTLTRPSVLCSQKKNSKKSAKEGKEIVKQKKTKTETAKLEKEKEVDEKSLTIFQRFKKTYKEHGKVLIGVHLVTSSVWFGSFFYAAKLGVDVIPVMEWLGFSETIIKPFRNSSLGDVALAYLMYKLATPARYTVTLAGTNFMIKYLRKVGRMAPKKESESLRRLAKDSRTEVSRRAKHLRSEVKHKTHKLRSDIQRSKFTMTVQARRRKLRDNFRARRRKLRERFRAGKNLLASKLKRGKK